MGCEAKRVCQGSSEDELRRRDETLSASEQALKDRERELASVRRIVRVAGITVDLHEGFSNGKRTPEYLAIHGLPPDAVDSQPTGSRGCIRRTATGPSNFWMR